MKVMFLGNNWVGWQVAELLASSGVEIVGAVLHEPQDEKYGEEIRKCLALDEDRVFYAKTLRDEETLAKIRALAPDLGVSAYFGTILKPEFLNIFPKGCINLHPALLPFNRGAHPNVWNIIEGTPAGATLHYIDEGVDTGRIIAQRQVDVRPIDTGKTLYRRLERACLDLFEKTWPKIVDGTAKPGMHFAGKGTFHTVADLKELDEIKSYRLYTAKEIVDILRARTFEPYDGVYMKVDGEKVYMRLELYYEDQKDHGQD